MHACDMFEPDPLPTCDESNPVEISPAAQYAAGVLRLMKTWYSCGKLLSEKDKTDEALLIGSALSDAMTSMGAKFSAWGVLGVMANESRFDRCALGLHPRKWAYEHRLIAKRKRSISHTMHEVLSFVESKQANKMFLKTGFDLGLCQVLSRFYDGDTKDLLSVYPGVRICVQEMLWRGTSAPWLYWRGRATEWYRDKIRKWARAMGAPPAELKKI